MNVQILFASIIAVPLIILRALQQQLVVCRSKQEESGSQETGSVRTHNGKHEADLWLVIPFKRIQPTLQNRLRQGGEFSADEAVTLVNDSAYFLATETAEHYNPHIPNNNDWQGFPEGGDLFIQFYIPDGGNLIRDDLKRSLSRKIADKEIITIERLALLNNFNGLQDFNRA